MLLTGKVKEDFEKWYISYIRKLDDVGERYFNDNFEEIL